MLRRVLTLLALLLACPAGRAQPCPAPGPRITCYYTSWSVYDRAFEVSAIDASRLTDINYAFANVDAATGTAALGDPWADIDRPGPGDCWDVGCLRGNFRRLELLKQANPHVRAFISVGGWTWSSAFSDIAATAASRTRFAQSVVDLFLRGQFGGTQGTHAGIFDGIDIDWEHPVSGGLTPGRPEDRANYPLLLQELRRQMDAYEAETGRQVELTVAVGAGPAHLDNLDVPGIAAVVDHVNVMSYDYRGSWDAVTGFNAPLRAATGEPPPAGMNVEETVARFLAAGCPPGKLVVGVPFYGRSWAGVRNQADGLFQPAGGAGPGTWEPGILDYAEVRASYVPGFPGFRHAEASVPWLFDGATFVSYDDPQSLRDKVALVQAQGLGGVMAWELSQDVRGVPAPPESLLFALHDALCAAAPPRVPGAIRDLRVARAGGDLLLTWTPDPDALGGYRLYDAASAAAAVQERASRGDAASWSAPAAPSLPQAWPGGVAGALTFLQLLGVASDGAAEGPN